MLISHRPILVLTAAIQIILHDIDGCFRAND